MGELIHLPKETLHNNLHIVIGAFYLPIEKLMKELKDCGMLQAMDFNDHMDVFFIRDSVYDIERGVGLKECMYVLELQLGADYSEYFIEAQIHILRHHFKSIQKNV
jgi:hypothetical protein